MKHKAYYHLPGLFEFYEFYCHFLPLYRSHREYFYEWCDIGSIYGCPSDCIWAGGRVSSGTAKPEDVYALMQEYEISPRLTFSNSLLRDEHLADWRCSRLCSVFGGNRAESEEENINGNNYENEPEDADGVSRKTGRENKAESGLEDEDRFRTEGESENKNRSTRSGVIIHSELLLNYLEKNYPDFYFVSSTTKVLTDFGQLLGELKRDEFSYVVPDFRLNKAFDDLSALPQDLKDKVEFLCNECCFFGCGERKLCYENVSRKNLGEPCPDHVCRAPGGDKGYRFSEAMGNPGFIGTEDIQNTYLPMGFSNFKIEGRGLGSAVILEFLLYYMTKPEYRLKVREEIYLDSMLDLF